MVDKRKAIGNYEASDTDELSFEKGEIIEVLDQDEDGWWYCKRLANNAEGFAPKNYLSDNPIPDIASSASTLGVSSPGASTGIRAKILALQAQNAANARSDKDSFDGLDELEVFSRKVEFHMVSGERSILTSTPGREHASCEYANSDGSAIPGEIFNIDDDDDDSSFSEAQHRDTSTPVDRTVEESAAGDDATSASSEPATDVVIAASEIDVAPAGAAVSIPEPSDPILRIAHGKLMRGVIDEDEYKQILIVHRKMRMLVASTTDEEDSAWGGSSSTDGDQQVHGGSRNTDVVFTAVSTYDDLDQVDSPVDRGGTGGNSVATVGDVGEGADAQDMHVAAGTHHTLSDDSVASVALVEAGEAVIDSTEYDLASAAASSEEVAVAPGTTAVYPLAMNENVDSIHYAGGTEYALASSSAGNRISVVDGKVSGSTAKGGANLEYLQKMLTERGNEVADLSSEVHRLREDLVDSQAVITLLRKQLRDSQHNVESERLATATAKQELAEHVSNRPTSQYSSPTEPDHAAQEEIDDLKVQLTGFEQAKKEEIDAIKFRHHIELKKFGSILEMLSREKRADKPGVRSASASDVIVRRNKKKKRTLPTPPVASSVLL